MPLEPNHIVGLSAGAGLAVLGLLAFRRSRREPDPVARPFVFLAFDLAIWNIATTLHAMTGDEMWHWIDVAFSPFTPPLVLHLVTAYTGHARRLRLLLRVAYGAFAILSLTSIAAAFATWARTWVMSSAWSITYLAGWLPIMALSLFLLVRLTRAHRDTPLVALRARLLAAAILVAGLLGSTELWDDLVRVPSLGALGTFVAMLLMGAVLLRFDLVVGTPKRALATYVAVVGGLVATLVAMLLSAPELDAAVLSIVVTVIVLGVAFTVRDVVSDAAERRARAGYLASLGRFSAQMAHDLKNPLAAMKGAAQYLEGTPLLPADRDILTLLSQQVGRMEAIIERYRRLAKTEVVPVALAPDALASDVARALTIGRDQVRLALEPGAPGAFRADRDLVASALENLVKNALDAMPAGGRLTVRTRRAADVLALEVEDEGQGIDPRYLERVGDDFFTTKTDGSGLGLAFARRVAEAHRGGLRIESRPGRGTRVTMTMMDCGEGI